MTCLTYKCVWHDSLANHQRRQERLSLVNACDMTDTLISETWLISESNSLVWMPVIWQTHLYVRHDSIIWWLNHMDHAFTCVTWVIHVFICVTWPIGDLNSLSWTRVTWHIHMCGMTHSHVWHDSWTCVTWIIHMCDMTHSRVWHCVTCLVHVCDMTDSYGWHCVTRLIHMCDMTHWRI